MVLAGVLHECKLSHVMMEPHGTMTTICENCDSTLFPRGLRPPRFCPRCGHRLGMLTAAGPVTAPREEVHTSGAAIAALVLGILSILIPIGCLPFGIPALIVGSIASNRIHDSAGCLGGAGMATAGKTLGIIGMILWLLVLFAVR